MFIVFKLLYLYIIKVSVGLAMTIRIIFKTRFKFIKISFTLGTTICLSPKNVISNISTL